MKFQTREIDGETYIKFDKELDRKKYLHGNMIAVLLIVILVLLSAFLFYYMYTNMKELRANPFLVGAKKISEINDNQTVNCYCSVGSKQFSFSNIEWDIGIDFSQSFTTDK